MSNPAIPRNYLVMVCSHSALLGLLSALGARFDTSYILAMTDLRYNDANSAEIVPKRYKRGCSEDISIIKFR